MILFRRRMTFSLFLLGEDEITDESWKSQTEIACVGEMMMFHADATINLDSAQIFRIVHCR